MRKTKIICTIGPASSSEGTIRGLVKRGMNVCRLNFSHGDHDSHGEVIDRIHAIRQEMDVPLGILLDTKGPELRLGNFAAPVKLTEGQLFTLTTVGMQGDSNGAHINFAGLPRDVSPGDSILLDDGIIILKVEEVRDGTDIVCRVMNSGEISSRKKFTVPGISLSMPGLTDADRDDLLFGIEKNVDFVAASFTRKAQDILQVRQFLEDNGGKHIQIIAKIENQEGLNHIEDIISVSDGIMVARGDLGVEIPAEDVPIAQKRIVAECIDRNTPVIIATQMLDSMIRNPMPTRAEVSDVANAVQEYVDCVMLSGETAAGKYPLEALEMMARICERTEHSMDYHEHFRRRMNGGPVRTVTDAVSHAVCMSAMDLGAAAIVTSTKTGSTAVTVANHRPCCTILATTMSQTTYYQLSLLWGTQPVMTPVFTNTDEMIENSVAAALDRGVANNGDILVITAGVPAGQVGTTNLIKIHHVGNILIKGRGVGDTPATGRVCMVNSFAEAREHFVDGDILALPTTDNSYLPFIKRAAALITRDTTPNSHAAVVGLALDIPVILDAGNMVEVLRSGMCVTVDPRTGYVYNGRATLL